MAQSWTKAQKQEKFLELQRFYVKESRPISEVGKILGIAEQTVFQRLRYFGIPSNPNFKRRQDVVLPKSYTPDLAEFFGVMLGDGNLSRFQVQVTLGTKELSYAEGIVNLIYKIFGAKPKISIRSTGYKTVYLGSVAITNWLRREGLVHNKVAAQVDCPKWVFGQRIFMERFLRGFFDTDGSIYRLRWGMQIAFNNESIPLLKSTRNMLLYLGYTPSQISGYKLYLTRKEGVQRFFRDIQPRNPKHRQRFLDFSSKKRAVS